MDSCRRIVCVVFAYTVVDLQGDIGFKYSFSSHTNATRINNVILILMNFLNVSAQPYLVVSHIIHRKIGVLFNTFLVKCSLYGIRGIQ